MGSRVKPSERNETGSFDIHSISSNIRHFKKPMQKDQENKILAMHKAGRVNASIYVAIVLAVYLVLLTILLCRYARRKNRSGEDSSYFHPHSLQHVPITPSDNVSCCAGGPVATIIRLCPCFNGKTSGSENSVEEPQQSYPLETIELHGKPLAIPSSSSCPTVSITRNGIPDDKIPPAPVNV